MFQLLLVHAPLQVVAPGQERCAAQRFGLRGEEVGADVYAVLWRVFCGRSPNNTLGDSRVGQVGTLDHDHVAGYPAMARGQCDYR